MKSTYLFILFLALVGSFLSVGCMFKDGDSKTLKEEKAKELERVRKQKERDRIAGMSVDDIKIELKKEMLAEKQKAKLKSDADTRKSLSGVQKIAALFILLGLALIYFLPAGKKKWGIGLTSAAVTAILICATLSYYLDAFRLVTAIILGLLVIAGLIVGVLWFRKASALKQVVATSQKLIDKDPDKFKAMVDAGEVDHDESTKAQVKAVKKKL